MSTKRFLARANLDAKRRRTNSYNMRRNAFSHSPPEVKNRQTTIGNDFTVSNTVTFPLTDIAAGSGVSARVGGKIKLKSAFAHLKNPGTTIVRYIMYVPKSITDRVALTNQSDPVDKDLFWVLKDFYIDTRNESAHKNMKQNFPMGMVVEYFGGSATDITKNGIYLYAHGAASGNMSGYHELWFIDN